MELKLQSTFDNETKVTKKKPTYRAMQIKTSIIKYKDVTKKKNINSGKSNLEEVTEQLQERNKW